VAILAAALAAPLAVLAAVTAKEIEEALTCQCGCGLTVHSCNHLQCGSAIPLRREVLSLVNQGLERDEILLRFRQKYGEKILSAPVAEGFTWTAWLLPFVAVGAGGVAVVLVVRRWTSRHDSRLGSVRELSPEERKRLEEELRWEEE
jgi:cytochrome c-type biogenesis protein CcmH